MAIQSRWYRTGREKSLSSIIGWVATVRVTTVATRATPGVPVWVLDDDARAGHVLGVHRHGTVPVGWDGVHDLLLLGLNVYRYGLRVPVLNRLTIGPVHVTVATSWDGDCSGSWVLHRSRAIVWRIEGSSNERSAVSIRRRKV